MLPLPSREAYIPLACRCTYPVAQSELKLNDQWIEIEYTIMKTVGSWKSHQHQWYVTLIELKAECRELENLLLHCL